MVSSVLAESRQTVVLETPRRSLINSHGGWEMSLAPPSISKYRLWDYDAISGSEGCKSAQALVNYTVSAHQCSTSYSRNGNEEPAQRRAPLVAL